MTDATVSRLLAALEALERDTPHSKLCDTIRWGDARCDCDYDVRRRLAIAQRIEAAIRAAYSNYLFSEAGARQSEERAVATFASPGREET